MVITKEELQRAFERAKQHAREVYPQYDKMLNYINLEISDNFAMQKHTFAAAVYGQSLIIAYLPALQKYNAEHNAIYDEPSLYYIFVHEFAHIIQFKIDRNSPNHGSIFKTVARNLGLKNPAGTAPPIGHTMYILSVPMRTNSSKIVKKRFYVMQEWLDKHPEDKQYVIDSYNHP